MSQENKNNKENKDNKNNNLKTEISKILEKIGQQKDNSLKSIEDFKNSITSKFDKQIDNLYKKRDLLKEMFLRKKELKKYKVSIWQRLKMAGPKKIFKSIISAPFIYGMIIPSIIMHLCLEIYHQVCFRLYKIPLVKAKDYFKFDRSHLPYLNWFEKINCLYCSYFNCLVAYLREIAGRTERYWCPIKHSKNLHGRHGQYSKFCDFSDAKGLQESWKELREFKEFKD